MSRRPSDRADDAGWYEVRLDGRLDPRWSTWLDGVQVTVGAHGTTVLTGYIVDQSALHGLLTQVRDIGLPLISVARVKPETGRGSTAQTNPTNPAKPTGD
jgi:hypothetical protein